VIGDLQAAFEADYVVLGGGNAVRLKRKHLLARVELGDNDNAFIGGLRLWRQRNGRIALTAHARRASARKAS
jgi:hypothetical protein